MRIKICIDIWRDVFDFLPPSDHEQIARKSNQINDREFSGLLQKWLHEWTENVRLGPMIIKSSSDGDRRCLRQGRLVNTFAEVEMPDNIRDFKRIHIRYLDSTVISFLRRMQPLFLNKVYFGVYKVDESRLGDIRTALDHLIPLLGGRINTISLCHENLLFMIRDRFPAQFYGVKFIIIWLWNNISIPTAELAELLLEWMVTRSEDCQPRMLMLHAFNFNYAAWVIEFIERIRQQLINANSSPANFLFICNGSFGNIQESTTQNTGTDEQLVIRKWEWDRNVGFIGRCPSNVDGQKWVVEMNQKACETKGQAGRREIRIADLKLGPFEEAELEEKEKSEEDVDQPGPSKQ